jgi:hypothetical protein
MPRLVIPRVVFNGCDLGCCDQTLDSIDLDVGLAVAFDLRKAAGPASGASNISTMTADAASRFAGPEAALRARAYFQALKGKSLKIIRAYATH